MIIKNIRGLKIFDFSAPTVDINTYKSHYMTHFHSEIFIYTFYPLNQKLIKYNNQYYQFQYDIDYNDFCLQHKINYFYIFLNSNFYLIKNNKLINLAYWKYNKLIITNIYFNDQLQIKYAIPNYLNIISEAYYLSLSLLQQKMNELNNLYASLNLLQQI